MKRPTVRHLTGDMQKEVPKKRKIQPVFLGCIGSGLEQSQPPGPSFTTSNVLTSTTKEPKQSETALRANPSLIDRVGNEEEAGTNNKEILDMNEDSMNYSTSFLNASVDNNDKNQDDKLRQLPEIIPEIGCELKPFPQAINLQNIANVRLPTPQIRRNVSIQIPMGPKCGVDQILAKNALKRGIKYSKMQAKFGRELKWERTIGSPLILMQANGDWTCCTHEDRNLIVYSTPNGKISFSVHTNSTIAILEIRNDLCLAVGIEGELTIWDLRKSIRLLQTSIKTLLLGCTSGTLQIIHATISTNGVPILVLNNGDAFLFSRSLHSWLSLNLSGDFLLSHMASFQLISHSLPNGLISMFIELLNCGKLAPSTSTPQIDDQQMELANSDAQMEMLLRAATELEAPEEFRLLAAIYLQKLIKNGKFEKMREFIDEMKQCPNIPINPEIILADVKPILKQNELKLDEIMKKRGRIGEFESTLSLLELN